jgi:integrase
VGCTIIPVALLKLYRRHRKNCICSYAKEQRIYEPKTKRERLRDCDCSISAEGTLPGGQYLTNKSTGVNDWPEAHQVIKNWLAWDSVKPSAEVEQENPTIAYVVERFMASIGPSGTNVEPSTHRKFEVFLGQRLLPFVSHQGYSRISELDHLDKISKFVESWRNLNPHRNKKNLPDRQVPLAPATRRAELERLRYFLRYCLDRGWISKNHAQKIKATSAIAKKFGFELDEESRIWAALELVEDGNGRTGQYNAKELGAFCKVMRYAGLRISDTTLLNHRQIVPRKSANGWAIELVQIKTNDLVTIPIPPDLVNELRHLDFKGTRDGKRYWFWSGVGQTDTAISNWRDRVSRLLKLAQREQKFIHSATPHTFRHTFSISHLNNGVDIKTVSRWLGHRSIVTTEKHYSHAIRDTHIAAELAYDASLLRQGRISTFTLVQDSV